MSRARLAAALGCSVVVVGAGGCRADEPAGPSAAMQGDVSSPGGAQRVRRLSVREYRRVVSDLLGENVSADRFLPETSETGYDNGPANLTVQSDEGATFEQIAGELASAAVTRHRDRLLGACSVDAQGAAACRHAFFDGFAVRAFRRPLTAGETARLGALFDSASNLAGFDGGLETTTLAILQSPGFLYREEIGEGAASDAPGAVRLTPYELASELSFLFTGTTPDDALFAAARQGTLETPDDVRREAGRLLATPAARDQLTRLADEWLATSRLATLVKDPAVYPGFDAAAEGAMRAELDRFYGDALVDRGTLADLLGGAAPGDGPLPDPAARTGVLALAGFLTVHSGYSDSNPIERGVFVRAALLCAPPHPPPPGVPHTVPADDTRTTRDRYAAHASSSFCQGCHQAIDGIGFGFEEFDGVGAYRTQENGYPVDTSGFLLDSDGADGPFVGVSQLEARLVASPRLPECFVRQVYRFALGVAETDRDQPTVGALAGGFSAQSPIAGLLLDLVGRRAFLERWMEEATP